MTTKQFTLAGIAGGITTLIFGFLLYGFALAGFFEVNAGSATGVAKEPMEIWALILGNMGWGFVFAYVFGNWASISTPQGGLKGGAILGLLIAIAMDFTSLGTSNVMSLTGVLVDIVVWTLISALIGAVVGWVLGRTK